MKVGQSNNKKSVLEHLLEQGMVLVAFDARVDGVDVPDHLLADPQLRLNLSYRFGRPIAVDPWGINAQLTFGGVPYDCRIPFTAVYLIVSHVSGEPHLFPDDVPPELLSQASGVLQMPDPPVGKTKSTAPSRPKLSLVPHDKEDDAQESEPSRGPAGKLKQATPAPTLTELPTAKAQSDGNQEEQQPAVKKRSPGKKAAVKRKEESETESDPGDDAARPRGNKEPPHQPRTKRRDRSHLRVIK